MSARASHDLGGTFEEVIKRMQLIYHFFLIDCELQVETRAISVTGRLASGQDHESKIMYLVSWFMYLVSWFMYHVCCIMYHGSCILYHGSCIWYHVSCVMYLVKLSQ